MKEILQLNDRASRRSKLISKLSRGQVYPAISGHNLLHIMKEHRAIAVVPGRYFLPLCFQTFSIREEASNEVSSMGPVFAHDKGMVSKD